jgi:hydrogenase 3 maturation protease
MGIGNPDRGDDGAGLLVAGLLAEALPDGGLPDGRTVTVLMAGEVPESYLGPAAAAHPDAVLLVDAVEMGAEPGAASLLEPEDLRAGAAFTHRTPLALLSKFLRRETGADILLLAVQPRSVEWGEPMSPEVQEAARRLGDILASALHREAAAC